MTRDQPPLGLLCDLYEQLWEENFEWSNLGQERRYEALTDRCIVQIMHKSDFQIFKTLLDCVPSLTL